MPSSAAAAVRLPLWRRRHIIICSYSRSASVLGSPSPIGNRATLGADGAGPGAFEGIDQRLRFPLEKEKPTDSNPWAFCCQTQTATAAYEPACGTASAGAGI